MITTLLSVVLTVWTPPANDPAHIAYLQNHIDSPQTLAMFEASNALTSCVVAGLGSVYHDGSFLAGCGMGIVGGSIAFGAKFIASKDQLTPGLGAVSRFVGYVGNSITYAGVHNTPFDSVYFDVGPVGFTLSRHSHLSFTLTPIVAMAEFLHNGDRFDWRRSLYDLTPTFVDRSLNDNYGGQTLGNVVEYRNTYSQSKASGWYEPNLPVSVNQQHLYLEHESVHVVQWSDFAAFNLFIGPYNFGQDGAYTIYGLMNLSSSTYYYHPSEVEAYGLVARGNGK